MKQQDGISNKHRQIYKEAKQNLSTNKIYTHKKKNTE